jgi:hypothetical protein
MTFIVKMGAEVGFDLSREINAWIGDDGFMHTINHPKQRVLNTLMHLAAAKAELHLDSPELRTPDDALAHSFVLPVYPEIAEYLNVTGSLDFKCLVHTDDGRRFSVVPLSAYIEETYRMYRDAQISPADLSPSVAEAAAIINRAVARGEMEMNYEDRNSIKREISSAGVPPSDHRQAGQPAGWPCGRALDPRIRGSMSFLRSTSGISTR